MALVGVRSHRVGNLGSRNVSGTQISGVDTAKEAVETPNSLLL